MTEVVYVLLVDGELRGTFKRSLEAHNKGKKLVEAGEGTEFRIIMSELVGG
jgi:hypothetical protein